MNEQIRKIYSKLISPAYTKSVSSGRMGATVDLSETAHGIAAIYTFIELQKNKWTEEERIELKKMHDSAMEQYEQVAKEKEKERQRQEQLPKTEGEAFFINSQLLHDINIDYKVNTGILVCESIQNFYQLSECGLEIYLYYRTNLRNGILSDVPIGFMNLYLKEVCGIIEHKKPQQAFEQLLRLQTFTEKVEFAQKYREMVIRAIKYVSVLYYDKIPNATAYIKKYFYDKNLDYEVKYNFLNGKFQDCIDYINKLSAYKFMSSSFYINNAQFYNRCLIRCMDAFIKICEEYHFDFTRACIGYHKEIQYRENLFYGNSKFWYDGKICLDNGFYVRVHRGKIVETVISRGYQADDSVEKAKGMLYYLVWYLEKVMRAYKGTKRNVHPTLNRLDMLREKSIYHDDLTKLREIYLSEEFTNMIDRVVREECQNEKYKER